MEKDREEMKARIQKVKPQSYFSQEKKKAVSVKVECTLFEDYHKKVLDDIERK